MSAGEWRGHSESDVMTEEEEEHERRSGRLVGLRRGLSSLRDNIAESCFAGFVVKGRDGFFTFFRHALC